MSPSIIASGRACLAALLGALTLAACAGGAVVGNPVVAPTAGAAIDPTAADLESSFISVINQVSPSVVVIQSAGGLGSGVLVDAQGDIVTNAHVVAGSSTFLVLLPTGKSYSGKLVGTFVPDDLAVIRISAPDLKPATFGDSDKLRVGSIVIAIGSPLGLQSSVTEGIVSALGREVTEPNGIALPPLIQTSADINPGNSGGALANLHGEVIGIPTLAAQDPQAGGTAPGIGFAIPSTVARDIASQLIRDGRVTNSHRAYLGVQVAALSTGSGVVIYSLVTGGPAEAAGLKVGDVISAVAGRVVSDQAALASVLSTLQPGHAVSIEVVRSDGSRVTAQVTLGELPA